MKARLPQHRALDELVAEARDLQQDLASRKAAFNKLVTAYQDLAVGIAYSYLRDTGLAEDAAQESFLLAWRSLPKLRDARLFVPWLKRILESQCHRVLRRKGGRFIELLDARSDINVDEIVNRRERERMIREALAHLPAGEREVVTLFYYSRKSHRAIADFLGVPASTVTKRLNSARGRLRAALQPLRTVIDDARPSRDRSFAELVRAGIYKDYVGLYRFERRPELTVKVERVGNRLVSISAGQKNTARLGGKLSELRVREFDGHAHFVRDRSGKVTHFVYFEFGKRMGIARKIDG